MEASCALPIRKPTSIDGNEYADGSFSVGYPIQKALEDGHEEILVLSSRPRDYHKKQAFRRALRAAAFYSHIISRPSLEKLCHQYGSHLQQADDLVVKNPERVEMIEPERQILWGILDTNKKRINNSFDMGMKCAEKWLSSHGY